MKSIEKSDKNISKFLILHDIRSAQNVGSLFRTADAAGIEMIYLSNITPSPIDRFGRPNSQVIKTSLGAEKSVKWEMYSDLPNLITNLKKDKVQIIAIEQSESSLDYKKVSVKVPVAFILGNEVTGISQEVLNHVDEVVEIPMSGKKESLNVAVAGGIALFRMLGM